MSRRKQEFDLPALNVPKHDREALAILRELPEESFARLLVELERSPTSTPTIPQLSPDDSDAILDVVTSLHRVRAYSEVSNDEFIDDVCASLIEKDDLPANSEPTFRKRLASLLDLNALSIAGKANALRAEYDKIYCSARILTDLRPVFGMSPSEPPAAIFINHTLKIDYHTGVDGHIQEFYVALGSADLADLQGILNRAAEKASSLGSALANSNIRLIDPRP